MDTLRSENLIDEDSVRNILENKLVLIVPKESTLGLSSFEEVAEDKVKIVGLGDAESVPAGQYATQVFTYLGVLDEVNKKANLGTDVRTVLSWVEEGEVDCGVVYVTDANVSSGVDIVSEAPPNSCDKIIYPAGIVTASDNKYAAQEFVDYLNSDEAMKVFEKYGFLNAE